MDLRIVNTCNNNCLYCLEKSLRNNEKYISKDLIFDIISKSKDKENITFY
jgi:molybdenum cofactor biosynthesis enzyme MoaA